MWRLRRIPTFEAALIELRRENLPSGEPVIAFQNSRETLTALFRYEAAIMNSFNRTLQQLLFLQDRRARDEDESQTVDVQPAPSNGGDAASQ